MGRRNKILLYSGAALLACLFFYLFFARIALYMISISQGLDIRYGKLKNAGFKELLFDDLKISEKKNGIGFLAKKAKIRPQWSQKFLSEPAFDMKLYDVSFLKRDREDPTRYSDIDDLVAAPFKSSCRYKEISLKIKKMRDGMLIEGLDAKSDDIRLSLNGSLKTDNTIDLAIIIYFSDTLTRKVPEELTKVILKDDKAGWKSLSVNLRGNYSTPSIQLTGKLFRLNIKAISQ
ncbi:MAG: hypothetical protein PHP46_02275 [Candidatus Omnitrophica bacterium]|nr:hypothetical protein [Candidatus Omnitrophota bacterium]